MDMPTDFLRSLPARLRPRRRTLHPVPDEMALSWQRTLALWEVLREEASSGSEREEIDAVFSRQVP